MYIFTRDSTPFSIKLTPIDSTIKPIIRDKAAIPLFPKNLVNCCEERRIRYEAAATSIMAAIIKPTSL
jgi:hypothetical protein